MPPPDVWISPSGKKIFTPLENNPSVFTSLAQTLGLPPSLHFHDVPILSPLPHPTHALIFIAPAPVYHAVRQSDTNNNNLPPPPAESQPLTYRGSGPNEPVTWFRQTIGNACGLMSLIHAVANGPARAHLIPGSVLDRILTAAEPLQPEDRARLLYESSELEVAHSEAAGRGDSALPGQREHVGYHFITFVRGKDGHLWELEGGSDGPVDRGMLGVGGGEDMLSEEALSLGVRRYFDVADGNLEFSIVALTEGE